MAARLGPLALLLAALAAQALGRSEIAFYVVVAAVPVTAVGALAVLGELVDRPEATRLRLETAIATVVLVALLTAAVLERQ